jgi:hypothetical protein
MRKPKRRASVFQQMHGYSNRFLLISRKPLPPFTEFVGVFNVPSHRRNIAPIKYSFNGIYSLINEWTTDQA